MMKMKNYGKIMMKIKMKMMMIVMKVMKVIRNLKKFNKNKYNKNNNKRKQKNNNQNHHQVNHLMMNQKKKMNNNLNNKIKNLQYIQMDQMKMITYIDKKRILDTILVIKNKNNNLFDIFYCVFINQKFKRKLIL